MDMPARGPTLAMAMALLAIAYAALGTLAFGTQTVTPWVTSLFPAAGVALAGALRWGCRPVFPAVFAGSVAIGINAHLPLSVDIVMSLANALEATLACRLLQRGANDGHSFYQPQDVAKYAALTGFACLISSALAVGALLLSNELAGMPALQVIGTRALAHWAGMLIVTPTLLLWRFHPRLSGKALPLLEGAAIGAACAAVCWLLFSGHTGLSAHRYPLSFLIAPLTMWPAVRMGLRETATTLTLVAVATFLGTSAGYGPFASLPAYAATTVLQAFLCVQSLVAMTLASAVSRARDDSAALDAARRRLQLVIDSSPAFIAYLDRELNYRLVNKQIESWFGKSAAEIVGRPMGETALPAGKERLSQLIDKARRGRRAQELVQFKDGQGRTRWIVVTCTPEEDADGFVLHSVDVTHQKEVEEALREAERRLRRVNTELERRVAGRTKRLRQVNEELEAFCYSVAHDLRSPLRKMSGFSEAVLHDYGDKLGERGGDYLRRIFDSSRRMGKLIDEMLDLTMVTRREAVEEVVDLSALARRVLEALRAAEPERRVEAVVADGLLARGDPALLEAALRHLLDNAWKFTRPTEKARVEFGMLPREPEPVYFVRDNGVGFDMAYAPKLFGAFERLHDEEFPGAGIGLAAVQRVVQRHGGRVWAQAEPGKGATFYFTLHEPPG
jgi:PAS domain S-box-containing protein